MIRIRIIHRLRTVSAVAVFALILGAVGVLWWANYTGLPPSWREGIEKALAANGIHAEVASLRYLPLRGIEAGEVVIYTDASRTRVGTRLEKLILDVDRTKLARGDVRIDQLNLSGAKVTLAADPQDPDSKFIEIEDLQGRIKFNGERGIEISNASGTVSGIRLELNAIMQLYKAGRQLTQEELEYAQAERKRILESIVDALDSAEIQAETPPVVRIDARGDLESQESLRVAITIQGKDFKSRDLALNEIYFRGELHGPLLVVHEGRVKSADGGMLTGQMEYDLNNQAGRFDFQSVISFKKLIGQLRIPLPEELPSFGAPPRVNAHGEFKRVKNDWEYNVMGDVELKEPSFHQFSADWVTTRFSMAGSFFSVDNWRLLLEDLSVANKGRELNGRAFFDSGIIRYQATSDLPAAFWQNIIQFEPLSTILDDFTPGDAATAAITFEGQANIHDPKDWYFRGAASVTNTAYRGTPCHSASVDMDFDHSKLLFSNGEADLDFTDYVLRKRNGGPVSGKVTVKSVKWSPADLTIEIDDLEGRVWPAPVVRMFAVEVADHLESYKFHGTPSIQADGIIGFEESLPKQSLRVRFSSDKPANYEFLDSDLTLYAPRGTVQILPDRVTVSSLSFGVFGGKVRGNLMSGLQGGRKQRVSGELDWTKLQMSQIADTYKFESEPKGNLTGRMEFSLNGEDVSGLNGNGVIAWEETELFEVPMFGPLSPLISAVLGKRFGGFQEANSAFCSFRVKNGVFSTADFLTTTTSLVFTGDGSADMNAKTLDFTIRMNARGFLGVITLPLRPFYGLFQFRGSGAIENPKWENVIFTSPPPEQESQLLKPPKARAVEPAPAER